MPKLADNFVLLEKIGLKIAPYKVVFNSKAAINAADELGYPVVLKIGSDIHKKDVGGVITNIHNGLDMSDLWREMQENLEKAGVGPDECVVQQQIPGVELVIGLKKDPVFGDIIMLGSGGTLAEVIEDVVFRVCPINFQDADEMISEIKASKLLKGFRGEKPANLEALKDAMFKLSRMHRHMEFKEVDVNPIIVNEDGAFVADARIVE